MAVNKYFNNFAYKREQDLVEDLTIESIKMYGQDMKYIPRTVVKRDDLYVEDTLSKFTTAADVECISRILKVLKVKVTSYQSLVWK